MNCRLQQTKLLYRRRPFQKPYNSMDNPDNLTMETETSDLCPVAASQDSVDLADQPKTLAESNLLLLKQKKYCDVTFTFPNLPDRIEAHEFCLKARSAVFEQLFRMRKSGNVQGNEIEISESNPETFQQFLEFIYSDKLKVGIAGALDLLHLAQKYKIQSLIKKCEQLLKTKIKVKASVKVFEAARRYGRQDLMDQAGDIMAESCAKLLDIGALVNADEDTIVYLLERDDLSVTEVSLFEFILEWGKNQIATHAEAQLLKDKLKNVSSKIRYTNMTPNEFYKAVIPTGLLSSDETLSVYYHFSGDEIMRKEMNIKFNTTPRKPVKLESYAGFYAGKDEFQAITPAPFNQCISFRAERSCIGNKEWPDYLLKKVVITGVKFEWPAFNIEPGKKDMKTLNFNICLKEYSGPVNALNPTVKFQTSLSNCKSGAKVDIPVEPSVEFNSGSTYCVIVEDQSTCDVDGVSVVVTRGSRLSYKSWQIDINSELVLEMEGVGVTLKGIQKDDKFFGLDYPVNYQPIDVIRGIKVGLV